MTPEEVEEAVDRLRSEFEAHLDDGTAHQHRDELYICLLQSIANKTCDEPVRCAQIALEAEELKFTRWYD